MYNNTNNMIADNVVPTNKKIETLGLGESLEKLERDFSVLVELLAMFRDKADPLMKKQSPETQISNNNIETTVSNNASDRTCRVEFIRHRVCTMHIFVESLINDIDV